jgi:hypothetical protein
MVSSVLKDARSALVRMTKAEDEREGEGGLIGIGVGDCGW